jgi:hypothetical protein
VIDPSWDNLSPEEIIARLKREESERTRYTNGNGQGVFEPLNIRSAADDPDTIEPRPWLLGNQFCRGFLSSLTGPGAVGKTALRLLQFVSLVTGRELSSQHVFKRSRVLIISLEDDATEIQRRIRAIREFHGIPKSELAELFYDCPKMSRLALLHGRQRIVGPLEKQLRHAVETFKPDLLSLDPFVKSHALSENDNGDMDFVCDLLATIAMDYNIAIDSPHHVHKGTITPGDANAGRGASGIKDAARLVYTLSTMSKEEAEEFGIGPDDRASYIRLDPAKVNITKHASMATWFRLHSQPIGNGTEDYPNGDDMQVAKPWTPPGRWEGTETVGLNKVLDDLAAGPGDGHRYSSAPGAKERAAWRVVRKHYPDKTEPQCRQMVTGWLKTGLLHEQEFRDPDTRRKRQGLYVNDAKRPS